MMFIIVTFVYISMSVVSEYLKIEAGDNMTGAPHKYNNVMLSIITVSRHYIVILEAEHCTRSQH